MLHLLGSPTAQSDGHQVDVPLNKPSWLLFYLAYYGEWISREELAFFFRPEADEASARRYVRKLLNGARKLPWAQGLEVEGDRLRWNVETDVSRFRQAVAQERWFEATQLYGGSFLAGLSAASSPSYDAWLSLERETLEDLWKDASLHYAADLESSGQHRKAAAVAKSLLDANSFAEDALGSFLRNAYLSGQRESALDVAERFREDLASELGLEPLEETSRLIETIRASRPLEKREVARSYGRRSTDRALPSEQESQLEELVSLLGSADARLLTVAGSDARGDTLLIAKRVPDSSVALFAIAELAERLTREGHAERALELLVLVLRHPACDARTRQKATGLWTRLEPDLPAQLAQSVKERWRGETLANAA